MSDQSYWILWLALGLVIAMFELLRPKSLVTAFSAGAFVGALAAFLNFSIISQLQAFVVASLIFGMLRVHRSEKFDVYSWFQKNEGLDKFDGFQTVITEEVEPHIGVGKISVDGEDWYVFTEDQQPIYKGSKVQVRAISGTRLIVEVVK